MARLNEAPLPTESVDALKRRFIRQNRELAKNNSAQCLKIRSLECDVTRLLAENLDLREEILRLQTDLSSAQSQANTSAAVVSVKDQLEAKLREFGALVSELGNLPGQTPLAHNNTSDKKDPDPSSWRPAVPVAALSSQSSRLSEIFEERQSPGGTLHSDDTRVVRLSEHSNESPDLGPPPVAHFDCEEPIKFDLGSKPKTGHAPLMTTTDPTLPLILTADDGPPTTTADHGEETSDSPDFPATLSVNLETRRKRRDTHTRMDAKSIPLLPPPSGDEDVAASRPSFKRKLSMRDAEEADIKPVKDDFVFSRRLSVNGDTRKITSSTDDAVHVTETDTKTTFDAPKSSPKRERRVLGDKSVNMSPRKATANKGKDGLVKPDKPTRGQGRERKPRASAVNVPQSQDIVLGTVELSRPETGGVALAPPETPAPDVFSPAPSEPSVSRPDGRDTPPPSGLSSTSSTSSALTGASRPSRRARAAVNYAEPNLISKMRRPTKELADAVALAARQSAQNAAEAEANKTRTEAKQEDGRNSDWKSSRRGNDTQHAEAGSPLRGKGSEQPADVFQMAEPEKVDTQQSASGRAIAALMANGAKNKNMTSGDLVFKMEETTSKMQEMDLYDFKDSSPADVDEAEREGPKTTSRRHSSMAGSVSRDVSRRRMSRVQQRPSSREGKEQDVAGKGGDDEGHDSTRVERMAGRRRSMMV